MADNKGGGDVGGGETEGPASSSNNGSGQDGSSSAGTEAQTVEEAESGEKAAAPVVPVAAPAEESPAPSSSAASSSSTPSGAVNLLDTCAVCNQSLQSREIEPKLLPCLHSFCRRCLPEPERQLSVPLPGGSNGDIQQGERESKSCAHWADMEDDPTWSHVRHLSVNMAGCAEGKHWACPGTSCPIRMLSLSEHWASGGLTRQLL